MENNIQKLNDATSLADLQSWLVSRDMIDKVIKQIEKDFAQLDLHFDIKNADIISTMQTHVENLLHNDNNRLQNLLYRIDINELKMTQLHRAHKTMPESDIITFLIIQREAQKVFFKEYYKNL